MLQCVAVCCSLLQCVAMCLKEISACNTLQHTAIIGAETFGLQHATPLWSNTIHTHKYPHFHPPPLETAFVRASPNTRAFRLSPAEFFCTPAARIDGASAIVTALVSVPFRCPASFSCDSSGQRST